MKKNKSIRDKAINAIQRRLKTLKKKGVALKIKPTKKNINEILRANHLNIDKNNQKAIKDQFVNDMQMITKDEAKSIKKKLGLTKYSDVQKIKGQQLHDIIADMYDNGEDVEADEVLAAYGY